MPSQAELAAERGEEDAIRTKESEASTKEELGDAAGAANDSRDAARRWADVGERYFQKSKENNRTNREEVEYRCRAGCSWLRAARDYERAGRLTAKPDESAALRTAANDAYHRAAMNFEVCGAMQLEQDNPEGARAGFVQADSCYLLWKNGLIKLDPDDSAVGRADLGRERVKEQLLEARRQVGERTRRK